jgi:hypothetical protein
MKKVFLLSIVAMFLSTAIVQAQQQQDEKITVSTKDLTIDQLAKIKAEAEIKTLQSKLDTYGKWVGVGGEIGTAVKEGLTAVVDVSEKFGKTDVGKFTLVMIAWKVMGEDAVGLVVGLLFFIVTVTLVTLFFKRITRTRKVLIKDNGWFKYPKEYKVIESDITGEALAWTYVVYIAVLLITIGISCAIIF